MTDRTLPEDEHCCARILLDGVACDMAEHNGIRCAGCIPYVHSDMSVDHEPGCPTIVITVTTEPDHG